MFGIDSGEILIIAVVALVVIGPKDLPRVMRTIGNFVGKARGMARHFRSGIDAMIREAELEDMEKQWQANNERIMREHPPAAADSDWGKPASEPAATEAAADAKPKAPPRRAPRPRRAKSDSTKPGESTKPSAPVLPSAPAAPPPDEPS